VTIDMVPLRRIPSKGGRPRLWSESDLDKIEVTLEQPDGKALAGSRGHESYWTAYGRARKLRTLLRRRGVLVEHRVWRELDGWRWGITLIGYADDNEQEA
jgi:hypothetical protein